MRPSTLIINFNSAAQNLQNLLPNPVSMVMINYQLRYFLYHLNLLFRPDNLLINSAECIRFPCEMQQDRFPVECSRTKFLCRIYAGQIYLQNVAGYISLQNVAGYISLQNVQDIFHCRMQQDIFPCRMQQDIFPCRMQQNRFPCRMQQSTLDFSLVHTPPAPPPSSLSLQFMNYANKCSDTCERPKLTSSTLR